MDDFWKMKLAAFLHDTPDKQLALATHKEKARKAQSVAGLPDNKDHGITPADWFDSAAERFAFPKEKCSHDFVRAPLFIHPFSSKQQKFSPDFTAQDGELSGTIQAAINGVETDDWNKKFFLYWRSWFINAIHKQPALAFFPADSRIPDHSIWIHMSITSALAPCIENNTVKPELLLFQFTPIQEFIAQSRSTRDLWSGSYLISWLMANAMKAVSDEIGPDTIIFPNLRGNGIFDALHKDSMYDTKWKNGDGSYDITWKRILNSDFKGNLDKMTDWLMTPTLPNRFLAVVPAGHGAELAKKAETALRKELTDISEHVWKWLLEHGAKSEWKARWDEQIRTFPKIAYATQSWLDRDKCLTEVSKLPKDEKDEQGVAGRLQAMLNITEKLPQEDKDPRYFTADGKLNNSGLLWSAHYALLDAKLAARRNTRDFSQWNPVSKDAAVKDSLSGKEECIGNEVFWKQLPKDIFKPASHRYGALNLIKRLWCLPDSGAYLFDKLGLPQNAYIKGVRFDSLEDVAKADKDNPDTYVAVLAMDGDEMGKWISGAKTPEFLNQLAPKARDYLKEKAGNLHRLLTPAYHLQFSEALANFAMHCSRDIVEKHDGELIYAGGDDVLAILPAREGIPCAQELRKAFQVDFGVDGKIYPGSTAEVSVGLAFGHFKAPLQMLVKEAQAAEYDAKHIHGRAAIAVRLYKRSGEIIHWGCKWKSNAIALMKQITKLTSEKKLSGRFPYALAARLQPYGNFGEDMLEVVKLEVRDVLKQQGSALSDGERESLAKEADQYLESCAPRRADFLNLFLTESFINRTRGEEK